MGFCPSSGPFLDINDETIAISYTSYNHENAYISLSTLDNLEFSNYLSLNSTSNSFQNYPYILLDNNLHVVWVDLNSFDIYYGMTDIQINLMLNN